MSRSPHLSGVCIYCGPWQNVLYCAVLIVGVVTCGIHVHVFVSVACHEQAVETVVIVVDTHKLMLPCKAPVPPTNGIGDCVGAYFPYVFKFHVKEYSVAFNLHTVVLEVVGKHIAPVFIGVSALVEVTVYITAFNVYPCYWVVGKSGTVIRGIRCYGVAYEEYSIILCNGNHVQTLDKCLLGIHYTPVGKWVVFCYFIQFQECSWFYVVYEY